MTGLWSVSVRKSLVFYANEHYFEIFHEIYSAKKIPEGILMRLKNRFYPNSKFKKITLEKNGIFYCRGLLVPEYPKQILNILRTPFPSQSLHNEKVKGVPFDRMSFCPK